MKKFLFILSLIPSSLFAGSVAGTGGSTEVTQIANNIELAKQYSELSHQTDQLEGQLRRQREMVSDMNLQGKSLKNWDWGNTKNDLSDLSKAVMKGQSLAYSLDTIDLLYRKTYPGYETFIKERGLSEEMKEGRYAAWSKANIDTIRSSMNAAQISDSQFRTEEKTMTTLERLSQTAEGRMQALQVGHQIASQQVRQVQKLRALMLTQMQMQASFMAHEQNEKDAQTAESKKFFDRDQDTKVGNGGEF